MPVLSLFFEGDNCWPDLPQKRVIHLGQGAPPIGIAALEGGMQSGKTSVTIRIDLPDGSVVLAETSLALFLMAARGLRARFGDEDEETVPL